MRTIKSLSLLILLSLCWVSLAQETSFAQYKISTKGKPTKSRKAANRKRAPAKRASKVNHQIPVKSDTNSSSVGITLAVIARDNNGDLWAGGSVFLQRGLLLRVRNNRITAMTLPDVKWQVRDLVFTGPNTGWMIADWDDLYNTNDGGLTWQKAQIDKVTRFFNGLCFSDSQDGWVVGEDGVIIHTIDGGLSWQKQNSGTTVDLKKILFVDALNGWAMGWNPTYKSEKGPKFITTNDGGRTWRQLLNDNSIELRDFVFVNKYRGWGLDVKNNILHTNDGGETWVIQDPGEGTRLDTLSFFNEREGIAIGEVFLQTHDGGLSWKYRSDVGTYVYTEPRQILFADKLNGWRIEFGPELMRTIDGGRTWKKLSGKWRSAVAETVYQEVFGNNNSQP